MEQLQENDAHLCLLPTHNGETQLILRLLPIPKPFIVLVHYQYDDAVVCVPFGCAHFVDLTRVHSVYPYVSDARQRHDGITFWGGRTQTWIPSAVMHSVVRDELEHFSDLLGLRCDGVYHYIKIHSTVREGEESMLLRLDMSTSAERDESPHRPRGRDVAEFLVQNPETDRKHAMSFVLHGIDIGHHVIRVGLLPEERELAWEDVMRRVVPDIEDALPARFKLLYVGDPAWSTLHAHVLDYMRFMQWHRFPEHRHA